MALIAMSLVLPMAIITKVAHLLWVASGRKWKRLPPGVYVTVVVVYAVAAYTWWLQWGVK